jgi:hypothetical protein
MLLCSCEVKDKCEGLLNSDYLSNARILNVIDR